MRTSLSGAVLAAERRGDGVTVYLDFEGDWHEDLTVAVVARAADERRALADRAAYETQRALLQRPHLLEISEWYGRVSPRPLGISAPRPSAGEGLPAAAPVAPVVLAEDAGAGPLAGPPLVRERAAGDTSRSCSPWAA